MFNSRKFNRIAEHVSEYRERYIGGALTAAAVAVLGGLVTNEFGNRYVAPVQGPVCERDGSDLTNSRRAAQQALSKVRVWFGGISPRGERDFFRETEDCTDAALQHSVGILHLMRGGVEAEELARKTLEIRDSTRLR